MSTRLEIKILVQSAFSYQFLTGFFILSLKCDLCASEVQKKSIKRIYNDINSQLKIDYVRFEKCVI